MTLKEHLKLFWHLRNGTKIFDAKFVKRYLKLFLGGGSYKNSGARQCHLRKRSATTNNLFFVMKEWPEKAQNVLFKV
jgi:hypothetical protein